MTPAAGWHGHALLRDHDEVTGRRLSRHMVTQQRDHATRPRHMVTQQRVTMPPTHAARATILQMVRIVRFMAAKTAPHFAVALREPEAISSRSGCNVKPFAVAVVRPSWTGAAGLSFCVTMLTSASGALALPLPKTL